MSRKPTELTGTLRIIGGRWRGRKLKFLATEGLRPTPDRVRETLFNWLSLDLQGARCLDLFAGSGALGLEALSRGAASCDFVESSRTASRRLRENLEALHDAKGAVHNQDALAFLQSRSERFDLVFMDPPFGSGLANICCQHLLEADAVATEGALYIESGAGDTAPVLPTDWTLQREKQAGRVNYRLYRQAEK